MTFNPNKSVLFMIGKEYDHIAYDLTVGNQSLAWSQTLNYLGVNIRSGYMLDVDVCVNLRRFYSAANGILSNVKFASEITKLHLLESFCLPLLCYACEVISLTKTSRSNCKSCYNQ